MLEMQRKRIESAESLLNRSTTSHFHVFTGHLPLDTNERQEVAIVSILYRYTLLVKRDYCFSINSQEYQEYKEYIQNKTNRMEIMKTGIFEGIFCRTSNFTVNRIHSLYQF